MGAERYIVTIKRLKVTFVFSTYFGFPQKLFRIIYRNSERNTRGNFHGIYTDRFAV